MAMSHDAPFSMPESLATITPLFERFCMQNELTIISEAIDRHGSWEWSAARESDSLRLISLDLTEQEDTPEQGEYDAEIWATVRQGDLWTRKRLARFKLSPAAAGSDLLSRLSRSWMRALSLIPERPINGINESSLVGPGVPVLSHPA